MNNNWLNENTKQIEYYLSSNDVILVDRKKSLELFLFLFESYFEKREGRVMLDFGCGTGALTRIISDKYPGNEFNLLDGSKIMLDKARENFKGMTASYILTSFEDFIIENKEEQKYDFIFSSMAIHHLPYYEKARLFSTFYTLLKWNGLFINIDVVLPSSIKTEEIQFQMWLRSIAIELSSQNREHELEKHNDLPIVYKTKPENKPSSLTSQLSLLEQTGFRDVECYLKNGIFVLYGGLKA